MTQERFKQSFKDANELISIAGYFTGRGNKISSFDKAALWFDMSSEISYIDSLVKDKTHPVHIEHVHALMRAKVVSNSVITFVTIMEGGGTVSKALKEACIWVVDSRYALREDRRIRCEAALRQIYEFTPKHQVMLDKLLDCD